MDYHILPKDQWIGFAQLKRIYRNDFEKAKSEKKTIKEMDFIKKYSLPQFIKLLKDDGGYLLVKDACKKMIEYLTKRANDLEKGIDDEDGRIYLIKDGKRQMSYYEFFTLSPKSKDFNIIPTHDVELIKQSRMKLFSVFEDEKRHLINENEINKVKTTDEDVAILYNELMKDKEFMSQYNNWLSNEIIIAKGWIDRIPAKNSKLFIADIIQIKKYITYLQSEIEHTSKQNAGNKKPNKSTNKTTYQWQGNEDELPELYKKLKDGNFIDKETNLKDFTAIFTGKPIESINPIKWNNNRLLAYFLETLFSGQDWQSIAEHGKLFKSIKGKLLNRNDLSKAKKDYLDYGLPKGYEKINQILKEIKNIKNIKTS
jgi:hypothetical protein